MYSIIGHSRKQDLLKSWCPCNMLIRVHRLSNRIWGLMLSDMEETRDAFALFGIRVVVSEEYKGPELDLEQNYSDWSPYGTIKLTEKLANLFVLLSIICVLLNLAGFILGCQGIQFVSRVSRCGSVDEGENKICFCCEEFGLTKCTEEETALKLYYAMSCSAAHLHLKKVLFGLVALNALTATVCLVAAAVCYLRIFATRRSCIDESEIEDQDHVSDPDDFVPPVPPPPYFTALYSCTPQMRHRMLGLDAIPLPHIYGTQIKGIETVCPLDPSPPYEAVWSQNSSQQEGPPQIGVVEVVPSEEVSDKQASQGEEIPESSSRVSLTPSNASPVPAEGAGRRAFSPSRKRSESDPVLHGRLLQGTVLGCEAATQTEVKPQLCTVTLQKSLRARALRGRPQSLTDYKSYTDTKWLVA
ncbi:hypothetical protein QYF61_002935 [Mycteria americana]|uniref:Protein FAM189A2 n=1 Tax=Mycteria americana TaxID=33587 RepID=A0AAN7S0T6_MYCAM|nr:hypothetical protein QYF61_002935 [Mycteria americana]